MGKTSRGGPPAYQMYAADFNLAVSGMDPASVGAYILLMNAQWEQGALPNDEKRLARITGFIDLQAFREAWSDIGHKFEIGDDGMLRQGRLEREREKQRAYREKQSQYGKTGAAARWGSHEVPHDQRPLATLSPTPKGTPSGSLRKPHWGLDGSPSPTPSPTPNSISDSKRENSCSTGSADKPSAVKKTGAKAPSDPTLEADFARWWDVYPRKAARINALKAFKAARKKKTVPAIDDLVAVTLRAIKANGWEGDNWTPLPASWLKAERWNDDLKSLEGSRTRRRGGARVHAPVDAETAAIWAATEEVNE